MKKQSLFLTTGAILLVFSTLAKAQSACTHLGGTVICPTGITPGSNSVSFTPTGILWSDGMTSIGFDPAPFISMGGGPTSAADTPEDFLASLLLRTGVTPDSIGTTQPRPTTGTTQPTLPEPWNSLLPRIISPEQLALIERFLNPDLFRRLKTSAGYASEDADRYRGYAEQERERARQWRELAQSAQAEADKYRRLAEETDDPELKESRNKTADSWQEDADRRNARANEHDQSAEDLDNKANANDERAAQFALEAENALAQAEASYAAEQEEARLARERAEAARIAAEQREFELERERLRRIQAEQQAEADRIAAEQRRRAAIERAQQEEWDRINQDAERLKANYERYKKAAERTGNSRHARRAQHFYDRWQAAEVVVGEFLDRISGYNDHGPATGSGSGVTVSTDPVGDALSGAPTADTVNSHLQQDFALKEGAGIASDVVTRGSASAARSFFGQLLGAIGDFKTIYDLGSAADANVADAPEDIRREIRVLDDVVDNGADPHDFNRVRLNHLKKRVFRFMDASGVGGEEH